MSGYILDYYDMDLTELVLWKNILHMIRLNITLRFKWDAGAVLFRKGKPAAPGNLDQLLSENDESVFQKSMRVIESNGRRGTGRQLFVFK